MGTPSLSPFSGTETGLGRESKSQPVAEPTPPTAGPSCLPLSALGGQGLSQMEWTERSNLAPPSKTWQYCSWGSVCLIPWYKHFPFFPLGDTTRVEDRQSSWEIPLRCPCEFSEKIGALPTPKSVAPNGPKYLPASAHTHPLTPALVHVYFC